MLSGLAAAHASQQPVLTVGATPTILSDSQWMCLRQVLGGLLLTMLVLFVFFVWSARKKKQAEMAAMGA